MICQLVDEAHTRRFAEVLAEVLAQAIEVPVCIYLSGELGAGKTTLVRFLLGALGYEGLVKSPTYGLVEHYALPEITVCHADLYRLGHPEELEMLDVRDWLQERTVLLVEWPERGAGILPVADLTFTLSHLDGPGRQLRLQSHGALGQRVLAAIPTSLFH